MLSITAKKFTPRLYNKEEQITGYVCDLLKDTQQRSHTVCKDTDISSHLLACRFKFSESEPCLKRSNTLFAFLTVLMPVCELDYACQYIPLCTYVCTDASVQQVT